MLVTIILFKKFAQTSKYKSSIYFVFAFERGNYRRGNLPQIFTYIYLSDTTLGFIGDYLLGDFIEYCLDLRTNRYFVTNHQHLAPKYQKNRTQILSYSRLTVYRTSDYS